VVTEASLIKEILTNKDDSYPKIDLQGYSKKLLGDGLSAAKGQKWAKLRKLSNHVFYAENLKVSYVLVSCYQKEITHIVVININILYAGYDSEYDHKCGRDARRMENI
jgi:hypothetical protein